MAYSRLCRKGLSRVLIAVRRRVCALYSPFVVVVIVPPLCVGLEVAPDLKPLSTYGVVLTAAKQSNFSRRLGASIPLVDLLGLYVGGVTTTLPLAINDQ